MRLFDLCVAKKLSGGSGGGDSRFSELVQRTITTASDSNATKIGEYAFSYCANLTSVDFPSATSIGEYAFSNCANLTSVDFPSATSIGEYAFSYCANLTSVDFPSATRIGSKAFFSCRNLSTLILRKRAVLSSTNAIPSQTIVYVENADLDWYSTAANWSEIYADGRIKSVEELPS